jgi:hypothetical protein
MPPSRSKLFRGRPNKLLIDDRAILIKMPDFQDAPQLEDEDEQDEFLIGEDFLIEEEEELEATPLRVFIGTANISEIQEDNSLMEEGGIVWDLSAMSESLDEDFEIFDELAQDDQASATLSIQLGDNPPLQTRVSSPDSAWALDEDDELKDDDTWEESGNSIEVGRIQVQIAIPKLAEDEAILEEAILEEDSDEDIDFTGGIPLEESEEDWGIFPNQDKASQPISNSQITIPPIFEDIENSADQDFPDADDTDPLMRWKDMGQLENPKAKVKSTEGKFDIEDPPEPILYRQLSEEIPKEVLDVPSRPGHEIYAKDVNFDNIPAVLGFGLDQDDITEEREPVHVRQNNKLNKQSHEDNEEFWKSADFWIVLTFVLLVFFFAMNVLF